MPPSKRDQNTHGLTPFAQRQNLEVQTNIFPQLSETSLTPPAPVASPGGLKPTPPGPQASLLPPTPSPCMMLFSCSFCMAQQPASPWLFQGHLCHPNLSICILYSIKKILILLISYKVQVLKLIWKEYVIAMRVTGATVEDMAANPWVEFQIQRKRMWL